MGKAQTCSKSPHSRGIHGYLISFIIETLNANYVALALDLFEQGSDGITFEELKELLSKNDLFDYDPVREAFMVIISIPSY